MLKLRLLSLNQIPIIEQLRLEEALLRTSHENWCLINTDAPSSIVMGISQDPKLVIDPNIYLEKPVPLIRRFSGGGTVFTDEHTVFVTFIINHEDLGIPPFPLEVLKWTEVFYQPLFKPWPFALNENDYVIGNKKCGGNAQYFTKKRWLHHTSFLWDYQKECMQYLLLPPKMPKYREKRSHDDFLFPLKNLFPEKEKLLHMFVEQLKQIFSIEEAALDQARSHLQLPHRSSTLFAENDFF